MWKGPEIHGVTQSLLNKFDECPYRFYLYAILGLKQREEERLALWWGDTYHVGLEHLLRDWDLKNACNKARKHLKQNYPLAPPHFKLTIPRMLTLYPKEKDKTPWETEKDLDEVIEIAGRKVRVRGKVDGIKYDYEKYNATVLREHKCKKYTDFPKFNQELSDNFQINLYAKITGAEYVIYDYIKIPGIQTYQPAQGRSTLEDWVDRMFTGPIGSYNGYYPINAHKAQWIHQKLHPLPPEKVEFYWQTRIVPRIQRICKWYDYVTQPGFDHQDPKWHNEIFYRQPVRQFDGSRTESYDCEYHDYILGIQDECDLVPVHSYFPELSND